MASIVFLCELFHMYSHSYLGQKQLESHMTGSFVLRIPVVSGVHHIKFRSIFNLIIQEVGHPCRCFLNLLFFFRNMVEGKWGGEG